jgi:hypothetical protein
MRHSVQNWRKETRNKAKEPPNFQRQNKRAQKGVKTFAKEGIEHIIGDSFSDAEYNYNVPIFIPYSHPPR